MNVGKGPWGGQNKIHLPVDEVSRRYKRGDSTTVLGRAYEVDPMTIRDRLLKAGVSLRPVGHPRPAGGPYFDSGIGYACTTGRDDKTCFIHRSCWEAYHGTVPNGSVVHHRNTDRGDNRIENLQCMTRARHSHLHGSCGVLDDKTVNLLSGAVMTLAATLEKEARE